MKAEIEKSIKTMPIILAVMGALYGVSPVDIVPDFIPFAGWMDDVVVVGGSILHLGQSFAKDTNDNFAKLIGIIKWGVIIFGAILVGVIALLGVAIYNIFN